MGLIVKLSEPLLFLEVSLRYAYIHFALAALLEDFVPVQLTTSSLLWIVARISPSSTTAPLKNIFCNSAAILMQHQYPSSAIPSPLSSRFVSSVLFRKILRQLSELSGY
ncbi:MAG: hypothetical protein IPG53_06475 [Ignavibacteriales bacterium]|nr:hypothetical protein [Ignavibacteriales bacterium]